MAGEVSQFLMHKFSTGLQGICEDSSLVLPYGKFIALEDLIKRKLGQPQSPDEMRSLTKKLHYLNNLLTECQMLSSKKGLYTPHEWLSIFYIRKSLKKIKSDIEGEGKSNRSSNQHQNGDLSTANGFQNRNDSSCLT